MIFVFSEPEIPDIVEEEEKEDTEIVAAQQNGADEAGAAAVSPGADSKASPKGMYIFVYRCLSPVKTDRLRVNPTRLRET